MKAHALLWLVAFAVAVAQPAAAQGTAADIEAKIKELDAKIQECEKLKQELEALRDDLAPKAEEKAKWSDKVKINGYFQNRYLQRDSGEDEFLLRRMYINLLVSPNDRTNAVVTWARIGPDPVETSSTDWANVFVDYKLSDQWTTRFGQGPDWFGLETQQSSSRRLALERAAILEGGQGKPLGMYFAGPWDRGLWLVRNPQKECEPQAILGILNGQFRGPEKDSNKTVSLDLKWKKSWGEFGGSWLEGKFTNSGGLTTDRSALLGYLRWDPPDCPWAIQGEYLDGELFSKDIDGGYVQLEHDVFSSDGTAFVKYESYDPDDSTPGGLFDAWHLGCAYQVDGNNELTLQLTSGEDRGVTNGDKDRDEIGLQWQMGF